jgi:hypothetical protein
MQLWRIRVVLWQLMAFVASVACLTASGVAFAAAPITATNVLTGWAALYGAPLILIFARGVPLVRAARIFGTIVLCGLPIVGFFGFFHLLIGLLILLLVGWIALMAVALFPSTLGKLVDTMDAPPPITVSDPELPPLVYDPNWARPSKTPAGGFWNGHWIGFLFLLPFLVMLVAHERLGISWAILGGDTPTDDDSRGFNLMLFVAHSLGSLAFVVYAFVLPIENGRGWRWVIPKLIFVAIYWVAGILAAAGLKNLHP